MININFRMLTLAAALVPFSLFAGIDLSGKWNVRLDSAATANRIVLPGTTDYAGIGVADTLSPLLQKPQLLHLTRKNSFIGNADYSRVVRIPAEMAGKPLRLKLERVLWQSRVAIDGKPLGQMQESLTTPHIFIIPEGLSEGEHTVTISVDNRKHYEMSGGNLAHAYTNDTQIMWNGVLGEMTLDVVPETDIPDVQVYPDVDGGRIVVKAVIDNSRKKKRNVELKWNVDGTDKSGGLSGSEKVRLFPGSNVVEFEIADSVLGKTLWSEFSPKVLTLGLEADGTRTSRDFGMRKIESRDGKLLLNDKPLFLRGTLECCVFPLTGTPPTTEAGWEKVFDTAKEWGLNHLRFHSWCPPEAAFRVADRKGFYVQVECPLWSTSISADSIGANGEVKRFIREEYDRIVKEYGNHPSFILMTMGNELQSDFDWLRNMTAHARATDPRHLYAASSFTFEKGHGGHPEPGDQFIVTQWTDNGWVRGQGVFDAEPPSFNKDYSASTAGLTVPLIEHEIGQYAVYPDVREIDRYTGVLKPLNFMAVREDLQRKGRLDRAGEYLDASGKLAAILYKEEIERAMKTSGTSGIQLLGLQDFPGQGTALVGLVNAFWESKGIVDAEWFRRFCSPIVPLAYFDKASYTNGETFEADITIANYSPSTDSWTAEWSLTDTEGQKIASGELSGNELINGLNPAGHIAVDLRNQDKAEKLTFSVKLPGNDAENSWSVWVYPEYDKPVDFGNVKATRSVEEALSLLEKGCDVLLSPERDFVNGTVSKFVPVFWSPVHFPAQAGAMGVTCRADHPALSEFPNDGHTDWQWWHAVKNSSYVSLDDYPGAVPIVEMVDNFTTNRQLVVMFETKVGKGRLLVSTIDILSPELHPTVRQLQQSVVDYMNSESFNPTDTMTAETLRNLTKK